MLKKSRTNSRTRQAYDHAYAMLRAWQHVERSPHMTADDCDQMRRIWYRNARLFAPRDGHFVEAYFWAQARKES